MLPSIVLLDLASDTFFILLSLLILGQIGKQRLGTIVKVCLLAMVAGFTADAVGLKILDLINVGQFPHMPIIYAFPICIILIASANYSFGRYYFKLNDGQSMTMGIIMGICTMPVGFLLAREAMSGLAASGIPGRLNIPIDPSISFVNIGIVFAAADILLLWVLQPSSALGAGKTALVGLAITVSATIFCFAPIRNAQKETRQIMVCSMNMRMLSMALRMYGDEYGDYPSGLSELPLRYVKDAKCLRCPLDEDHSSLTSFEYRKPPAYIMHPENSGIVRCPRHSVLPGYGECMNHRGELHRKIISYVGHNMRPVDDLQALVKKGICNDEDIRCNHMPAGGRQVYYSLARLSPEKMKRINESLQDPDNKTMTMQGHGFSQELIDFYDSANEVIRCPQHPSVSGSEECEARRRKMIWPIAEYKHRYGTLPSSLGLVEHVEMTCPSPGPDGKPVNYAYHKPPDDFDSAEAYWMLKCTHHPKYDVYGSAAGMPSMKALPKGESYK